jgi:hypothetical protein
MTEGPAAPSAADRATDGAEPDQDPPYAPPQLTRLGTLAELTAGTFTGDGGDISAYQS